MNSIQEPTHQELVMVAELLSTAGSTQAHHQSSIFQQLSQLQKNPTAYLCFLQISFTEAGAMPIRQLAAITLKTTLERNMDELPKQLIIIIRDQILSNYGRLPPTVAKNIGLTLNLIQQHQDQDLTILECLLSGCQQGNISALDCLTITLEDIRGKSQNSQLFGRANFSNFLSRLTTTLLQLADKKQLRSKAYHCFNILTSHLPQELESTLKHYVQVAANSLQDPDPQVNLRSMEALETLAEQRKDLITENMLRMVASCHFTDAKILRKQFLFWMEVIDMEQNDMLQQYIPLILPRIIQGMVFTKEDLANQMQKSHQLTLREDQQPEPTELDETSSSSEGHQHDDGEAGGYTLRKMTGGLISKIALNFPDGLWECSQSLVTQLFLDKDWHNCQIAVLYIGLTSQFLNEQFGENRSVLIVAISQVLEKWKTQSQLVSTALWTLSMFSKDILNISINNPKMLQSYINNLLHYVESDKNNVKQSAYTSLAKLMEEGAGKLSPMTFYHIAERLASRVPVETGDNLSSVLGSISTVCQHIPKEARTPQITQQLLKVLCEKWGKMQPKDMHLCSVVECLVLVCDGFGDFLKPFCVQIYQKALEVLNSDNKELTIRLMDLICALMEIPSDDLIKIISIDNRLLISLCSMIQGTDKQLKQSGYSLLSHLVRWVGVTQPQPLYQLVYTTMDRTNEALLNNCLFCLLQIMKKYPGIGQQHAEEICEICLNILRKLQPNKKIYMVNFSKIVGKLANIYPQILASKLKDMCKLCFSCLKSDFKDQNMVEAYRGYFQLIYLNPSAIMEDFHYVVDSYLHFKAPTSETDEIFKKLLTDYKMAVGAHWQQFLQKKCFLPAAVQKITKIVGN